MRSGEEIRAALIKFVGRWQHPYDPFTGRDGRAVAQQLGLPVA
ncbi:hypothetical protein ACGFIK_01490 [Micromonospora sp. NPDC048871]|nr:hypothetical protein OIE53_15285 [Micromonospora sp. NBC_01739]